MELAAKTFNDRRYGSASKYTKHRASSGGSSHDTSAGSEDRTWQSILDGLTIKAKKDGLLSAVKKAHGFEARLRKVMDCIAVRNKLASWISQCSESHYAKSGATAARLRDEGNMKFRAHDNRGSLRLYTESVICAPEFGPELSLALANRSACLYHQGYFENCLHDISLALRFRYPRNLEYKLFQRKAQCLTKLSRFKEAEEAFKSANDSLEFVLKISPEKRNLIIKDNEALLKENNARANAEAKSKAENPKAVQENNSLAENMASILTLECKQQSNSAGIDDSDLHYCPDVDFKSSIPPSFGQHPKFSSASAAIELKGGSFDSAIVDTSLLSNEKQSSIPENLTKRGRHVVANQAIGVGNILFSEMPYSSVLLPEHYSTHCHQCYITLIAPIPCLRCTQPRYCSDQCRQESWLGYHQFECTCLDLLHSVGIAHLAVRTIFIAGLKEVLAHRTVTTKVSQGNRKDSTTSSQKLSEGQMFKSNELDIERNDRYIDVWNLITHIDNLDSEDLFQYVVTAALLTTYLERRTNFFDTCTLSVIGRKEPCSAFNEKSLDVNNSKAGEIASGMGLTIKSSGSTSKEVDAVNEDLLIFVGSAILRHIVQLICNASAIYEVGPSKTTDIYNDNAFNVNSGLEPGQEEGKVVSNNQYRIATAIYSSASMMNHSCNPSVINSFYGRRLIVKAIKEIVPGDEIYNCYGPHFRRHTLKERQDMLKFQYHFTCDCNSCTKKELIDFQERFTALKCMFCEGPIKNPHSEASLNHRMPCLDCGKDQEYKSQIEQVFLAYDLYRKGMEYLRFGNMADTIPALQSCYQLRSKAMYAHHLEVTDVADQLARCYAMMGSFSESAEFLKVCLPAIQERFGANSVEVGHELVKYTDVLLGGLQDSTKRISLFEEKVLEANACLERAAQIFELHYGTWNKTYQEILQRLEKMKCLASNSEYLSSGSKPTIVANEYFRINEKEQV